MAIYNLDGQDITKVQAPKRKTVITDKRAYGERLRDAIERFGRNAIAINRTRSREDGKDLRVYGGGVFLTDGNLLQATTNRMPGELTERELDFIMYGTGCRLVRHNDTRLFFALDDNKSNKQDQYEQE